MKQAAAGRVRPDWPLSACFRRSGHQQGGPDAVLTDEAGGLAPWRGAENGCRTPAAREFMMIRRKGDLPLRADPETQRVLPPGQGPRWHQDPSSKRNERPAPDPAGRLASPSAPSPGGNRKRTAFPPPARNAATKTRAARTDRGQRPTRRARSARRGRGGRWPFVMPGPADLRGTVPNGRGSAVRFLIPPGGAIPLAGSGLFSRQAGGRIACSAAC